jgi:hypothetical protein
MDRQVITDIAREVYRRFPEMSGASPTVRRQDTPAGKEQYVLTFKATAGLPGGKSLQRIVRVTADSHGKIVRMSTSR